MEHAEQPYRSVLYMPGSNRRALDKARALPADALILDLEDAVAPAEKVGARALVCEAIRLGGYGGRRLIVRVNGLDAEWGRDDVAAAADAGPDAILLPKVETPEMIRDLADMIAHAPAALRIWAMIETPRGVLNAAAIAGSHPRLEGFVLGTNDLAKDLGATITPDRAPLVASLGLCLLAARAGGLVCVDGVYNAFRDDAGLRAACIQSRDFGFDGRSLIHPDQIAIANEIFAPSAEELALAERHVTAFDAAQARGEGVAVVDGRIVENLHVDMARRLLGRARSIAALEALTP